MGFHSISLKSETKEVLHSKFNVSQKFKINTILSQQLKRKIQIDIFIIKGFQYYFNKNPRFKISRYDLPMVIS